PRPLSIPHPPLSFHLSSHVAHRDLHSFPTRRSSDLEQEAECAQRDQGRRIPYPRLLDVLLNAAEPKNQPLDRAKYGMEEGPLALDRKSTRLNSSHGSISYAVFCLKKKRKG